MSSNLIDQLFVYLVSEDSANHFSEADFSEFRNSFPDTEIVFLDSENELLKNLPSIEWLDTWYFQESWFQLAPKLRGLFTPAAGRNWVAEDPRMIVPTYYGTFHGGMIAETMLGLMLHFSRNMPVMLAHQRAKIWDRNAQQHTRLLSNQSALIIGYGSIGKHCGRVLTQLGMTVYGAQRKRTDGIDASTGVEYVQMADVDTYLALADHVIMLLPGTEATHHFMNEARFNAMQPGAFFYNFGRGSTVDEQALNQHLSSGHLSGAGIDVTEVEPLPADSPLWEQPTLALLPHSSCVFEEYQALHVTELTNIFRDLSR